MDQHLKNQKNNFQKSILNILIFTILILFNINLYAKEKKVDRGASYLIETPTRFIIISDNSDGGGIPSYMMSCAKNIGCADAYYYEINKKTGKSLKLKGEPIIQLHTYTFKGYTFDYKDLSYSIYFQGGEQFVILRQHKKGNKLEWEDVLIEPIIKYDLEVLGE